MLSFELGLLWPGFMQFSGSIIGVPFSLEGFAFFTEAIFPGIYLYGWERVSPRLHLGAGVIVAISRAISGLLVLMVNGWQHAPAGFDVANGQAVNIDPFAAMFNPACPHIALHMTIAAYQSIAAAMMGIHGIMLLRDRSNQFHRKAFAFALTATLITSILQPLAGDFSARQVAQLQPAKLAAMEGQFKTEQGAPLRIGGIHNPDTQETPLAIEIPGLLSWLAFGDAGATVIGLEAFPRADWPPVLLIHLAFQIMAGSAFVMAGVAGLGTVLAWRRRRLPDLVLPNLTIQQAAGAEVTLQIAVIALVAGGADSVPLAVPAVSRVQGPQGVCVGRSAGGRSKRRAAVLNSFLFQDRRQPRMPRKTASANATPATMRHHGVASGCAASGSGVSDSSGSVATSDDGAISAG